MKRSARFFIVLYLLLCGETRAQTLVYSLCYSDTRASRQARFANVSPLPGLRSEEENMAMLRNARKTEIYSVSILDGRRSLLFSDENLHLEIAARASVSGRGKAYAAGVWRERRTTPIPGFYSDEGVYELSLDGSNHFRKIGDAQKQGPGALNPQGTKAAAESADAQSIFIYSVPEWRPLATLDLSKLAQTHCPDCTPASFGWLADGNRVFVDLVVAGEEDDNSAKVDHTGTYILSEDGTDIGAIPPETGAFQVAGYSHPKFIDHRFMGQLPDGRYVFLDYGVKQGKPSGQAEPFLVISGSDVKFQKHIHLNFPVGGYISPSGRYFAYLEQRQTPDYRSETHLWVMDLASGEERELASAPPPNGPNSPNPNMTLFVLGWVDQRESGEVKATQ